MNKPKLICHIDFNSPIILGMALLSLLILMGNTVSAGALNPILAIYYTSWADPLMYLRLLTHVLVHGNFAHYSGNFLLILALGPMVEEKYGGARLALMIAVTAVITGLVNVIFFQHVMLLGASGVVFMLILLASFTNVREGKLPITVLCVAALYIGNEVITGLMVEDNTSQISHILGGFCGAGFGYFFHGSKIRKRTY